MGPGLGDWDRAQPASVAWGSGGGKGVRGWGRWILWKWHGGVPAEGDCRELRLQKVGMGC